MYLKPLKLIMKAQFKIKKIPISKNLSPAKGCEKANAKNNKNILRATLLALMAEV